MNYIARTIEQEFLAAGKAHKVVYLGGAAGIGKSTMMKYLSQGEKRESASLEDPHLRVLAESEPQMFFEFFKAPMIIESVHLAPALLHRIKEVCENSEGTGLFWLTGPPGGPFVRQMKEVLGEDAVVLQMYGLSMREKAGIADPLIPDFSYEAMKARATSGASKSGIEVFRNIWRGSLPEMQDARQEDKAKYYWDYFHDSLMHQVEETKKVKYLNAFSDFLAVCAVNIGKVLSVRKMGLAAGICCPAAAAWLRILVDLGIIYLLAPYESDEHKRLITRPKLYFADTGFCSYISNWKTPEQLMKGREGDAYFENFVVMEFVKNFANREDIQLRFFRNRYSVEIDLLVAEGGAVHPFGIKKTTAPMETETEKFSILDGKSVARGCGGIISTCKELRRIDEKDYLLPCHIL